MPIYEFVCESCAHEFEKIVSFSATIAPTCPVCEGDDVKRRVSKPAIHFKGSGWYITDSKTNGKHSNGHDANGSEKSKESEDAKSASADSVTSESPKGESVKNDGAKGDGAKAETTKSDGVKSESATKTAVKSDG